MVRAEISLCVLILSACGGAPRSAPGVQPIVIIQPDDAWLADLLQAALEADTRLDPAQQLYEPEAPVLANGEQRFVPPRFAGLAPAGRVSISRSRIEVKSDWAWAWVEYRWIADDSSRLLEGTASFVLRRAAASEGGGWRILHAHSSSPHDRDHDPVRTPPAR